VPGSSPGKKRKRTSVLDPGISEREKKKPSRQISPARARALLEKEAAKKKRKKKKEAPGERPYLARGALRKKKKEGGSDCLPQQHKREKKTGLVQAKCGVKSAAEKKTAITAAPREREKKNQKPIFSTNRRALVDAEPATQEGKREKGEKTSRAHRSRPQTGRGKNERTGRAEGRPPRSSGRNCPRGKRKKKLLD